MSTKDIDRVCKIGEVIKASLMDGGGARAMQLRDTSSDEIAIFASMRLAGESSARIQLTLSLSAQHFRMPLAEAQYGGLRQDLCLVVSDASVPNVPLVVEVQSMSSGTMHHLGMVWYDESDYERTRSSMLDGDKLPGSYDDWLAAALLAESISSDVGLTVIRVHIDCDSFLEWCFERKIQPDLNGCSQYAFVHAHEIPVNSIHRAGQVERRREECSRTQSIKRTLDSTLTSSFSPVHYFAS